MAQFLAPAVSSLILVFLGVFVPILVQAKTTHYHDFVVKEKNFTRLCHTKSMLVVNGDFPGPTIYVNKGDLLFVNVHNQGDYGVTIHWHGVKQPRNPWSDGPEFVTQCAIEPGKNFTYEVIFSEEEGTLWWHAHNNWTRNTLHGAIVIYPDEGTSYPFLEPDGEQILILESINLLNELHGTTSVGSWYNYDVDLVVQQDRNEGIDFPESSAYLINGQPGDLFNCSIDSTYRWKVDHGKTYLVRLVNAIMNAEIFFAISGHNMTVVGTDGAYLKPFSTDYLMISPGKTMDVLVSANQIPSEYYMAIHQLYTGMITFTDYDKTNATAIVQYNINFTKLESPSFPDDLPSYTSFLDGIEFNKKLRSLVSAEYPISVPTNISTRMFVTVSMNRYSHKDAHNLSMFLDSALNNVSWIDPAMDVLQAYYRNISEYYTADFPDLPPQFFNFTAEDIGENTDNPLRATKVKVVEYGEEVEIIFQNTNLLNGSSDHPMHLHGHSFYVVGFGLGIFDKENDPLGYNLVDPPYVNTASLPKNGWLTIRFKANNPGVWLWHCHLDRHLSGGMNMVFIVKNGETVESTMREPPAGMPSCKVSSSYLQLYEHRNEQVITEKLSNNM